MLVINREHLDYFGVAATAYLLLFTTYMDIVKVGSSKTHSQLHTDLAAISNRLGIAGRRREASRGGGTSRSGRSFLLNF